MTWAWRSRLQEKKTWPYGHDKKTKFIYYDDDYQKHDIEKYLELELLAYQTAQEIGNAHAIYQIGWYLGGVLCESGTIEHGLPILQNVHQIGIQAGYSDVEKVGDLIKKYSNEVSKWIMTVQTPNTP